MNRKCCHKDRFNKYIFYDGRNSICYVVLKKQREKKQAVAERVECSGSC